ncbi:MAG TPA: UxaA family hydrolase, partial [Kineosporiaceae bacterium]
MTVTALRLGPDDDVAIVRSALAAGDVVDVPGVGALTSRADVPAGHKIAVRDLPAGRPVRKYGHVIGVTTRDVAAGEHVHLQNLAMPDDPRAVAVGHGRDDAHQTVSPQPELPAGRRRTFRG